MLQILFVEQQERLLQDLQLACQVILVLEQGVVDAGADQDEDQRRYDRIGDADLGLQLLGVLCVVFVDALEELLSVFDIFGVCIDLIHQSVFFSVFFGGPVGDLFNESYGVLRIGGGQSHEVILHLGHTVGGGLNDQIVQIFKVLIECGNIAAARFCHCFYAHAVQSVLGITVIGLFHDLGFFGLPGLLVYCAQCFFLSFSSC